MFEVAVPDGYICEERSTHYLYDHGGRIALNVAIFMSKTWPQQTIPIRTDYQDLAEFYVETVTKD